MRKQILKTISILIALSFLASCATMPGGTGGKDQPEAQAQPQKAPPNAAERAIFLQAVATGAGVGAAVGGILGAILAKDNRLGGAAIGATAGALVGGAAGALVAKKQIQDYRDIHLKNDQMEALLKNAKDYNSSVASQNDNLQQEIARLQVKKESQGKKVSKVKQKKAEQERILREKQAEEQRVQQAKEQLKQAEEQRILLAEAITERRQLSETLVKSQKEQYQETLNDLDRENARLDGIIKELRGISEPVRVGS